MTHRLTKAEQLRLDRERLATFVREIKHYRAQWGMPPDKIAFRNAWLMTYPPATNNADKMSAGEQT